MFKFSLLLLLGAASLSTCKATVISGEKHGPRKAMLSYKDSIPPLPVLWESWTPIATTQVPKLFSNSTSFDYWQVKDENEIEQVWSVLSTLLSAIRSQTEDAKMKLAIRSTLTLLEPTPIDRPISTLDFTFLTSSLSEKPINRWEGVAIRWFKKTYDGSPTITLFLSRRAMSQTKQFDLVHLWIEPGFSELPTQSVKMSHGKEWNYQTTQGVTFDLKGSEKYNATIYIDTLTATLWNNYTNASYVEYDKMEKEVIGEVFGKIKLRDIEMVFSHTQFPPKFKFK